MQPFGITTTGQGASQVQIVDPLHADVIKLMTARRPYKLRVPLIWLTPRTLGNAIETSTPQRKFDLLLLGARSALSYSLVRLKNDNTDDYYSNEYVEIFSFTGGAASDRQEYQWESFIWLPSNTTLVVSALLGETTPGSGVAEADGSIVFDCVVINA